MDTRRRRSSGDRKPPRSPSPRFKPILLKIGTPPFDTSGFVASPSLSTSLFKGRSSFDGESDPGRARIFLEQIAALLTRRKLLVFMIKVVEDRTRSIIDFLLAEDAEVERGLAVKGYGEAGRMERHDTGKR